MSYILDALKKSERERKKGQVPGLGTVQGLPGPGGRFETDRLIWMYAIATILLVALAVGVWLYLREPAPEPEKTPPPAAAQVPSEDKVAVKPAEKPAAQAKAKLKPATPPTPKTGKRQVTPPPAAGTGGTELLKAVVPETATPPAAPATPQVIEQPSPPQTQITKTTPDPLPAEKLAEEESETNPELLLTVPIEQLPAEIRAELPEIKIGVHLYSDIPESRRASINGRLMREGQQVGQDLLLVAITRQGAILSIRGRKFTVPVFPR